MQNMSSSNRRRDSDYQVGCSEGDQIGPFGLAFQSTRRRIDWVANIKLYGQLEWVYVEIISHVSSMRYIFIELYECASRADQQ